MTDRACCSPLTVVVDGVRDRRHTCPRKFWSLWRPFADSARDRLNGVGR